MSQVTDGDQMSFDDLDESDDAFGEGDCPWLVPTPLGSHPRFVGGRPSLVGQKIGRLTVIAFAGSNGREQRLWKCECECGNVVEVPTAALNNGNTQSCGCLHLETMTANGYSLKHGQSNTYTYRSWVAMRVRLRENPRYVHVTMDPRWEEFSAFFADMGERPAGTSLDRINNKLGYWPFNCRWASPPEQINNRSNSRAITFDGRTQSLARWAEEYEISYDLLFDRLGRGWPVEKALTTPRRGERGSSRGDTGL
jgi:hypothetical protein